MGLQLVVYTKSAILLEFRAYVSDLFAYVLQAFETKVEIALRQICWTSALEGCRENNFITTSLIGISWQSREKRFPG